MTKLGNSHIFDAHIHVGQFYNIYTSPSDLLQFLDKVGVERFAVSSTSICEGNYQKVLNEINQLYFLAGNRMSPVLWIIPQMFCDGGLELFLNSGVSWKCLKIHPQLHPNEWRPIGENMSMILKIAMAENLPILIHTGELDSCHAGLYLPLAKKNPHIIFILAHGRPIEETISVMKACDNVYVDTAFMPIENVIELCGHGLSNRIIWGSDYPIPKYYYKGENMHKYYGSLWKAMKSRMTPFEFEEITINNYSKIFVNRK